MDENAKESTIGYKGTQPETAPELVKQPLHSKALEENLGPGTTPMIPPIPPKVDTPPAKEKPSFILQVGSRVTFKLQNGPIKQVGVNGCQIDDVIKWAREFIQKAESRVPHIQNRGALKGLKNALYCLNLRTRDRERRGVEGYDIK